MNATRTLPTVREVERRIRKLGRIVTIDPEESAAAAAKLMSDHDVGSILVLSDDRSVAGILTERDITRKVVAKAANPAKVRVADIMTRHVVSCRMDSTVGRVRRLMTAHNVRHLPVIEDNVALGMISTRDILAYQLSRTKAIARHQSRLLDNIQREHPEVIPWRQDSSGRIVID